MPSELLVVAVAAVAVVDLLLLGAFAGPAVRRRLVGEPERGGAAHRGAALDIRAVTATDPESVIAGGVPIAAYDRVVRIASWAFILSTAVVVATTALWPDRQAAILAILGIGGLFVLVAHDVVPAGALGRSKYVVEGAVAIVLVTLIVLLTDGARSPFFFAFALVVAGAALVVPSRITVGLAAIAASGYLAAAGLAATAGPLPIATVALVGINLMALVLLAYVAMVVAGEQRRTRDAAVRLATIDPLTGLANRAFFLTAVEREIERSHRFGRGFCLLMADLDDLKLINDSYGHRVGDRALIGVAGVIHDGVRRIDTAARLGGDEFVVLLPETDPTGAYVVAEKICQAAAALELGDRETRIRIGISVGLAGWPDDGLTVDALMGAVDAAMYASKRRGKHGVGGLGGLGGFGGLGGLGGPTLGGLEPAVPVRFRADAGTTERVGATERAVAVPIGASQPAHPR